MIYPRMLLNLSCLLQHLISAIFLPYFTAYFSSFPFDGVLMSHKLNFMECGFARFHERTWNPIRLEYIRFQLRCRS
jgi:hypothetical protein